MDLVSGFNQPLLKRLEFVNWDDYPEKLYWNIKVKSDVPNHPPAIKLVRSTISPVDADLRGLPSLQDFFFGSVRWVGMGFTWVLPSV